MTSPIIDLHFHMLARNDVPGCELSDYARHQPPGLLVGLLLGTLDEDLLDMIFPKRKGGSPGRLTSALMRKRLLRELRESRYVDGAVLLALDQIHDENGNAVKSSVITTNEYVHSIITQHKAEAGNKRLFLGASVHPYRKDALEKLDMVKSMGAVLIKWIPSSQRIEPNKQRLRSYYEKLAALQLPLLCHCGPEGAIPDTAASEAWNRPKLLELSLECGVKVIVAHGASPYASATGDPSQINRVPELIELFKKADKNGWNLYTDVSALLLSSIRATAVRPLLAAVPPERIVYGSDFPIPTQDLSFFALKRGWDAKLAWQAQTTTNMLDKDVLSKRSVKLPESIFYNSARLLGIT